MCTYHDPSQDYFEPYSEAPFECYECQEKDVKLDTCREMLDEVVNQLYSTEPLDIPKLEFVLEELCHQLKTGFNAHLLQIQRP